MSDTLKLGNLVSADNYNKRDATHIAVAAVEAGEDLKPGEHVGLNKDGLAVAFIREEHNIGIVDPFLRVNVKKGDKFWLYLYPGSITSLEHKWSHPFFPENTEKKPVTDISRSENWMRKWAIAHMSYDYYGYHGASGGLSEEQAYQNAINAGHNMSVGPYESARDYIDDTWWTHWEIITGCKRPPEDDRYFSCGR